MENDMTPSAGRPSDRFIPYYIVGFFVFLTLLLSAFIYVAIHNYPGEVTRDPYQEGLHYNHIISEAAAQRRLGWKGHMKFDAHELTVHTCFSLADKNGKAITNADTRVWFIRPTHAGHDKDAVPLKADGKGNYSGVIHLAWPGDWEVHVSATSGNHNFQMIKQANLQ